MNICFICRNILRDRGGIETYTLELARALGEQGHMVHIIAQNKGNLSLGAVPKGITIHPVDFVENPFYGYLMMDRFIPIDDIRFSVSAARKIRDLSSFVKIDIVEATDYFRSGFWYAFNRKTPFLLRLHGWFFNRQDGRINPLGSLSLRERLLLWMQQKTIDRADIISVVSSDFRNFASEIWKINKEKYRVILNAVDTFRFKPDHALPKDLSVLYVGRLVKNKGILVLADAMGEILYHCPQTKFVFAGKDMFLKEAGCMAREYLAQKVPAAQLVFLGEVAPEELLSYYRKSSVVVFPSFYEACGIACLEAMACGCAIVASGVGGIKDMIHHQEQGLLVTPGRPQELAGAIVRFLQNAPLRESCAKKAVEKVTQEFNYDKLVRNTLAVYEETIANYQSSVLSSPNILFGDPKVAKW